MRVDVSEALNDKVKVSPVVNTDTEKSKKSRVSLNEEDFLLSVEQSAGRECAGVMQNFYDELVNEYGLELDFKAAAVMLKVPHPDGDGLGASVLGLEKQGRIYNTAHMPNQLKRWWLNSEIVEQITSEYWTALNAIDSRFMVDGMSHTKTDLFIPFSEITDKLPEIKVCVGKAVSAIQSAYEESR